MEILRFSLSGKNAFFKKPEFNAYYYFTYGNIHKVALLGMLGAILGYDGYNHMKGYGKEKKSTKLIKGYPQFYEKLKELKISIIPVREKGYISKKIQTFNNSVGYASKEQGGNLIVKEQWLENPEWEICILLDCEEAVKIKDFLCKKKCIYYPYLGKNDHPADIKNVRLEKAKIIDFIQGRVDCFALKGKFEILDLDYDDRLDLGIFSKFKYEEKLPYQLDIWTNQYIFETFFYTDDFVTTQKDSIVYELEDGKKITFY